MQRQRAGDEWRQEMERKGSSGAWVMCRQRERERGRKRESRRLVNVG